MARWYHLSVLAALALVVLQAPTVPQSLGWYDFPVFVWREEHAGKPLPPELVEPFGGVILMRGEDSAWARERGLAYMVWNVAGRDIFHLDADEAWRARVERWIETRDERLLVREPCLSDPATLQRAFATLDATLAQHGEHPGLAFVLGDEVSLTPNGDPFELCRCERCETQWAEFARSQELPARSPPTDDVLDALRGNDTTLLGPWLARRRFEQERLQEQLLALVRRAREGRRLEFALLGVKDRTAFGGLDLSAFWREIDVFEPYDVGLARPLSEALRIHNPSPASRTFHESSLATLFLENESPQGAAWLAWEAWLAGADSLVLWSDRALSAAPAMRARLAETVDSIRTLTRSYPSRVRAADRGWALLADGDATAYAWLLDAREDGAGWPRRRASYQEQHGSRETRLRAWREACRGLGVQLGALPLALLEFESLAPHTLVAVDIRLLDPADVAALERFLTRGGRLLVHGDFALLDRRGRPWKDPVLAGLEARHPGRVQRLEVDFFDKARSNGEGLRALLGNRASAAADYELRGTSAQVRWLRRSQLAFASECAFAAGCEPTLVTLLPDAPGPEQRRKLGAISLEVDAHGGEIEWLQPASGAMLRPGDAAVFLLHTEASTTPR